MNTYLRNAIRFSLIPSLHDIIVKDCRVLYVSNYSLFFCHNGKKHLLNSGDMIYIPKGTVYRFELPEQSQKPNVTILNFDMTRNKNTEPDIFYPVKYENGMSAPTLHHDIAFNNLSEADIFYSDIRIFRDKSFLSPLMNEIVEYFSRHDDLSHEIASCRTKEFLIRLSLEEPIVLSETVKKVKKAIDSRYSENLTNKSLAAEFGYHENSLNRLFLSETKCTIRQYLIFVRISKAKELLSESSLSLVAISEASGFNNYSYFSYYFNKKEGMTPREFRERLRNVT